MAENDNVVKKGKFSLIDLLMIIMIVGIIVTFIVPMKQTQKYHERVKEAIYNLQVIAQKDVEFKNNPENGYYAFDLSMLNIKDKLKKGKSDTEFYFEYSLTDSTVIAESKSSFGKEGVEIVYYLPEGPMLLGESQVSQDVIDPNWLP